MTAYHSTNGHTVKPYGRLFFIVTSASRAGLVHFVDFEAENEEGRIEIKPRCTCEDKNFRGGVCRHCLAALEAIAEGRGIAAPDPALRRRRRTYRLDNSKRFAKEKV